MNTLAPERASRARPNRRATRLVAGFAAMPAALLVVLAGCASPQQPALGGADTAAIAQVVEAFRTALVRKDKPAYMDLFFSAKPGEVGWQAVVDDPTLATIRVQRTEAIKARPRPSNNHVALIDSVVASAVVEEERISHLTIDTDGEVASASFDYTYLSDGKPTNAGREHWQLVRTEAGWKIFSVVYSIRAPGG